MEKIIMNWIYIHSSFFWLCNVVHHLEKQKALCEVFKRAFSCINNFLKIACIWASCHLTGKWSFLSTFSASKHSHDCSHRKESGFPWKSADLRMVRCVQLLLLNESTGKVLTANYSWSCPQIKQDLTKNFGGVGVCHLHTVLTITCLL